MAHVLIMPRQGNTVESCVIVDWKVTEGTVVSSETTVCEVETDKATFDVTAGADGTVLKILHGAGDDVPVLEPIAVIGTPGEDWAALVAGSAGGTSAGGNAADEKAAGGAGTGSPAVGAPKNSAAGPAGTSGPATAANQVGDGRVAVSPRARNLAEREAVNLSSVAPSGPQGRIIERDVQAALAQRPALTAGAKAAVMAGGGTISAEGSGLGGRITSADVIPGAAPSAKAAVPGTPGTAGTVPSMLAEGEDRTITPIKGIRKLIADRMLASLATTAQFTLSASANVVRLQELRSRMKSSPEDLGLAKVTINDMILFAVSRLLPLYPFMNAHKTEDALISFRSVHLGLAVDTPKGLMVPVIRHADTLSLAQISREAKRLAQACQNGTILPDELSGSTFTVTNLGALGVESFTPVLNVPEVAILGVCGISLKPVAVEQGGDGEDIAFLPHVGLSLTINHQVVDGAPAARFLKALSDAIADFDLWLAK